MKNRDKKRLLIELDGNYIVAGQVQIDFIESFVIEHNEDLFVLYQDGYLNREIFQEGQSITINPVLERPLTKRGREFLEKRWYTPLKRQSRFQVLRNSLLAAAIVITVILTIWEISIF